MSDLAFETIVEPIRPWLTRLLLIWSKSFHPGFRAAAYATAGWISLLTLEAISRDPYILLSLLAGPILELAYDHSGEWLRRYGPGQDEEDASNPTKDKAVPWNRNLNWKRALTISLVVSAPLSHDILLNWASEHLDQTIGSIGGFFVAGVVLSFLRTALSPLQEKIEQDNVIRLDIFVAWVCVGCVIGLVGANLTAALSFQLLALIDPTLRDPLFIRDNRSVLFIWWAPIFIGLILFKHPLRGAAACVLLVFTVGAAVTWHSRYEDAHLPVNSTFSLKPTPTMANPSQVSGPYSDLQPYFSNDIVGNLFNNLSRLAQKVAVEVFAPRAYVEAVKSRNVPTSSWEIAEEQLAADDEELGLTQPGSPKWLRFLADSIGQLIRFPAGCPTQNMPESDKEEAENVFYWMDQVEARWTVYDANHGVFCGQLARGLGSAMTRQWVLLLFFALGLSVNSGLRPQSEVGWKFAWQTLLKTAVVSAGLCSLMMWGGLLSRSPSIESFSVDPVVPGGSQPPKGRRLPAAGGSIRLSWSASRAHSYRIIADSAADVPNVPHGAIADTHLTLTLPPNRTSLPQEYRFVLEAYGIAQRRSRRFAVVEVEVQPIMPIRETDFGQTTQSDIKAVATDGRWIYITGKASSRTTQDKSHSYVAKVTRKLQLKWVTTESLLYQEPTKQDYFQMGPYPGEFNTIAADPSGNVYAGGYVAGGIDEFPEKDAIVMKWGPTGRRLWYRVIASDGVVEALALDSVGDLIVGGNTTSCIKGQIAAGQTDGFVAKLDVQSGALRWVRQFGSREGDFVTAAAVDEAGAVYLAGATEAIPVGYYAVGYPESRGYIAKFDRDGNPMWFRIVGPKVDSIKSAPNGGVFLAGSDMYGAFLSSYDTYGSRRWLHSASIGGKLAVSGNRIYEVAADKLAIFDDNGTESFFSQYIDSKNRTPSARGLALIGSNIVVAGVSSSSAFPDLDIGGDARPLLFSFRRAKMKTLSSTGGRK